MNNEILLEKEFTKYLGVVRQQIDLEYLMALVSCINSGDMCHKWHSEAFILHLYNQTNYCLPNWGNAAATNIKPTKTSLNKAVRAMAFKDSRHANSLYKKLKILPLDECYKLQLAKFVWKLENNKFPGHTASKYITITHDNTQQTIQSNLQLPSVRLDCAKRFTIYSGTHLWLTDCTDCT